MCGALVRGGGWCDKHADQRSGWERSHNGRTAAQRGYGREWRRLRTAVMQRDRALCQAHLIGGRYIAAQAVDHIVPKSAGGTDDAGNLQATLPSMPCNKNGEGRSRGWSHERDSSTRHARRQTVRVGTFLYMQN